MEFDSTDLAIAEILVAGPKTSNKSIAQTLALSEPTVASRIRKMQSKGALRVTIQWDVHAIGLLCSAQLMIRVNGRSEAQVAAELSELKEVVSVSQVKKAGYLLVDVNQADIQSLFDVVEGQLCKIKGLEVLELNPVISYVKFKSNTGMHVEVAPAPPPIPATGSPVRITQFDLDVFSHMRTDARVSYRQVARQLDVQESKVRRRVTQLIDDGVWQLNTVVHPEIFGFNACVIFRIRAACGSVQRIANELSQSESNAVVAIVAGAFNVYVIALGESIEALLLKYAEFARDRSEIVTYEPLPLLDSYYHCYDIRVGPT